jgi:hypothetical protein
MENIQKKNQTETNKNTMGGHSSRLEQVEDRISELKDKIEIRGKINLSQTNSRAVKGTCKNSLTPSKDQT